MDDLGEAVDGVLESVVEAVDEHQHTAVRALPDRGIEQALAPSLVSSSAFKVAKSVAGLDGSFFGQATSPTLRTGGIETVMFAKAGARARSPVNISPGTFERPRVVVISMSTRLVAGVLSATGVSTPLGCPPQPEMTTSVPQTTMLRRSRQSPEFFVQRF